MKKILRNTSILFASLLTMTSFESIANESSVAAPCIPTVTLTATPGTNICKGTEVTITSTVTNGGATPDYQWSVGGVAITDGSGNSDKITITPQLTGERYMLQVTNLDPTCPNNSKGVSSNIVFTLNDTLTGGHIVGTQEVCTGKLPTQITNSTNGDSLVNGGINGVTYKYTWESMTDATGIFTTIPGEIKSTYKPTNPLTESTYFRRVVTSGPSGVCPTQYSNTVKVSVLDIDFVSVNIDQLDTICEGTELTVYSTVSGDPNPTYRWCLNRDSNSTSYLGSNSPTFKYTPTKFEDGKYLRLIIVSSLKCPDINNLSSKAYRMSVIPSFVTSAELPSFDTTCFGVNKTIKLSFVQGKDETTTFSWFVNGAEVPGANADSLVSNSFAEGDSIFVKMTTNHECALKADTNSNTLAMTVSAAPIPVLSHIKNNAKTLVYNGDSIVVCYPELDTLSILQEPNTTYIWHSTVDPSRNLSLDTSVLVNDNGKYFVFADNGFCSISSDTIKGVVKTKPIANAGEDLYSLPDLPVQLFGQGGIDVSDKYSWTPIEFFVGSDTQKQNPVFVGDSSRQFILKVEDISGTCYSTDTVNVIIERPISLTNVITANNDGLNDTWKIPNIETYTSAAVEIYSRWGTLVHRVDGLYSLKEWAGKNYNNGEDLPVGTYFYVIDLKGKVFTTPYTGFIELVR